MPSITILKRTFPCRPGFLIGFLFCLFFTAGAANSTGPETTSEEPQPSAEEMPAPAESPPEPEIVETRHTIEIEGEEIAYTARAGKLHLLDREGNPTAEVFFVAYTRDDSAPEQRPVTFSFNGGPGSSSVWMHMGLLGPRRVALGEDGFGTPPPHRLADNPWSLLDVSDLVFIDPVSTGFSRPLDPEKEKEFHGLEPDVKAVGEFIRRYVTEFARWSSPKFLIGESYGTTRAAALSRHLQHRHGMYLNGIMLVSSVLDFATLRFSEDNDLPYVLFLPSMAATAHYHGQLSGDWQNRELPELLDEVEAFAMGPYRDALFAGDRLDPDELGKVARKLASFTGIALEEIISRKLRLDAFTFMDQLLAAEGKRVGRFDGRYSGVAALPWELENHGSIDPSYAQVYGAYSSGFNDYIRRELEYESDLPYEILASVWPWDYGEEFAARYVNVSKRLREAMVANPHLKVHICNGYYDLATPYLATRYTVNRLFLHPELRENISMSFYMAGHMMYTVPTELARQKKALRNFIRKAVQEP